MMKRKDLYMIYLWFWIISRFCLLPIHLTFNKRKRIDTDIDVDMNSTISSAVIECDSNDSKSNMEKKSCPTPNQNLNQSQNPRQLEFEIQAIGHIRIERKGWRRRLWRCWFIIGALYGGFLQVRLFQSIVWRQYVEMGHLSLHIVVGSFSVCMFLWGFIFFCRHPGVVEGIFNQLDLCDENHKVSRLSYSVQEWLILCLPFSLFLACMFLYINMYIHTPTSLEFIWSVVPPQHKTEMNFILLGVFEATLLFYYLCVVYFGIFTQLAFIKNFCDNLDQGANYVKSKEFVRTLKSLSCECIKGRKMELNLKYFNLVYSNIIFSWKLYLLTVSITPWYFGFKLMLDHPITSASSFFLAIYHTTIFTVMYDTAFSVPYKMERFKNEVLLVASKTLSVRKDWDEIKRKILSVPNIGIKVGSFHTLERTSTPNFVDFITKQVCSLLLTFR